MIIGFLSRKPNPGKLSYFMAQMHDNPVLKVKLYFAQTTIIGELVGT